jgi:rhomboid family GlyGly-CTERM serine protease
VNGSRVAAAARRPIGPRVGAWVPVLVIATIAVLFALGGEGARGALRFERGALEAGEVWRLLTGHLVHLGWGHLWMNLAALALIRLLIADAFATGDWIAAAVVSALAIDLGLYVLSPGIGWYVGLSGVLHGLLAAGALVLLRTQPLLGALLGGGLILKLLLEQTAGPLPLSETTAGGDVITEAHLYGAAAGTAYGALRATSRRGSASI